MHGKLTSWAEAKYMSGLQDLRGQQSERPAIRVQSTQRAGTGSRSSQVGGYAAKLEKARQQGQSTDPAEVLKA